MHEHSKEMTTPICRYETFQFEVMPFGLSNSNPTFQRMINISLAKVRSVKCYLDDTIVHSATMKELINHLDNLCPYYARMVPVPDQECFFMQPKVLLIGYVIDRYGIHTDIGKVQNVREAQPPGDAEDLRSFLGLASYYRRFIKGIAKTARPLSEKSKK